MSDVLNPQPENNEIKKKQENSFVDVDTMFDAMDDDEAWQLQQDIYKNYADAMRRRDREPIDDSSFDSHFFEGRNFEKSIAFGNKENGYLLGSEVNDVFIPTHFAPAGLKQGYRLIKDLMNSDKPTALFITDDLTDTIKKMDGWKILPFRVRAKFKGEDVSKNLVINK